MTKLADKALLPNGLEDVLPPAAAQEAAVVERLIACFSSRGYERVKPPLMEFEGALLSGAGAALSTQTFRLMDPVSQRMLALRADITPQVVRIAGSRLKSAPRPLRLCYGGQVLQVKGSQLRPERQFGQVGAELIGASEPAADAEVMILAAEALATIGVKELSLDLNLPTLVGALAAERRIEDERLATLRQALDRKDAAEVGRIAGADAEIFMALLRAAGPAEQAAGALARLELPKPAKNELERLQIVVAALQAGLPELTLTIDPVEHRGFEYQTGISFICLARGVRGELGRGGRYRAEGALGEAEEATGFTLFMDSVLRALPAATRKPRVFLPAGTAHADATRLQVEGWITLAGLAPVRDLVAEARRLACSHLYDGGQIHAVEP
ncbi:MAG: ATP phosphoribosyltransferase regulatory subunit [Kiloniellales bacterium]